MSQERPANTGDRIEPLLPQHVQSLRISWWSFFDQRSLYQHLLQYPGFSFRIKDENQYAIGSYWRGRPEIGLILEVAGSSGRSELINGMLEHFRRVGCAATVVAADEANRNATWYLQQGGWRILDEIVVYTRRDCHLYELPWPALSAERFRDEQIDELLELEKQAFPFLWWSGKEDFLRYAHVPEVRVFVLILDGRLAGYVSYTLRTRDGFLDRIAVSPSFQGKGYGAGLLSLALEKLDLAGAKKASLNTQVTNHRAQRLYQKYGFIRTNNVERIYGLWFREQPEVVSP